MSDHKLQNVRGTKDLFGEEILKFNDVIKKAQNKALAFGFEELQTPIFEFSEIFERNLGETSDIVAKEVYKFLDRGQNYLTLRPEFTAAIVRSLISNGALGHMMPKKFFSYGPIFRYDRPQSGRQRQFHQINYEIFGESNFYSDVDLIMLASLILDDLNILDKTILEINSLGDENTKKKYELALVEYLEKFKDDLSQDSKVRFEKNPLRILDSKDKKDIEILTTAPEIKDFYEAEIEQNFANILELLSKFDIKYEINPKLVRGLDYYTSTVFEFVTNDKKAQNTILAGGRYDNLVKKMGGSDVAALGFAAGVERLMLLSEFNLAKTRPVIVSYISQNEKEYAFDLLQYLRKNDVVAEFFYGANLKKQLKKATQNNARFVIMIGEDEINDNVVLVKDFDNGSENKISKSELINFLKCQA